MDIGTRTIRLADSLGLTGKHVFFNEQWVPYAERQNWLLDANCGVTTHFEHVETDVRVPHPGARLPVGRPADRDHRRRLVRRPRAGGAAGRRRPGRGRRAHWPTRWNMCLYDEEFAAGCVERIAVVARAVHLGRGAGAAGGVLPRPASGGRPAARLRGPLVHDAAGARPRDAAPRRRPGPGIPRAPAGRASWRGASAVASSRSRSNGSVVARSPQRAPRRHPAARRSAPASAGTPPR